MKEEKAAAKYTPSGQRKFKATLLSTKPLFSQLPTTAKEEASLTCEQLRFRMTRQDFRAQAEAPPLHFTPSEAKPESATLAPPPENFLPTSEDFQTKK